MLKYNKLKGGFIVSKSVEIGGCIEIPENIETNFVIDKFIEFVESNGWTFGGGFKTIVDDWYVNDKGEKIKPVGDE